MKVCLFVLIICITFLSSKAEDANPGSDMHIHPLVVNGNDADQHEWPWQVRLKRSGTFICGGSLISDNWVLTAAHCVDTNSNPAYYTVEVGAHWMSRSTAVQKSLAVTYLWYHKAFSRSHLRNDIALLLLNETVNITSKIRPIKLPRQGNRINAGRTCYITGWGRLRGYGSLPTVLQEAPLKIGSDSDCAQKNGNTFQASSMICAGSEGKGGCNGDSGGPLSCYEGGQWILRGVVSWGKVGCPTSYYTVFARVSSFVSWISRVKGQEGNVNCNFDDSSSLCQFSWKQDRFDDFDWTRNRGSTNYHGTGPSADHTKGTYYGYYMYTYTTYRKSGDKARLYSSPVNATNKCFSFWYHMHGRDIGALNVLVKAGQQNETLWSKKGPSGNRWLQGKINLRNQGKISIIFEAISGSGKEGHIAIDDVALTNGSCSISQSCRDQTCYNKGNAYCLNNTGYCYCQSGSYGQQCEFLSYNCSFDGGLCSLWDQDTTDVTDWTRYQGFTPDFGTGPSRDHTTGSGSFFYLETSNKRFGDTARLISKVLPATNNTCFTFWYHMYGKDINTLRILLKKAGQQTVVWSRKIQTGRNQWFEGKATLNSDEPFQVVIEGVVGNGYLGDIGIDDVSIVNETCSISKSCRDQTCYNDGHAYCLNNTGHCYCPDDSIGQQCERYRCDFNKDLCDDLWHQERTTDRFDWTRNQGPTNVANTGPSADHINKVDHVSHQTYITVKTSCTYTTINKYNGRFTSPNYPSYYKNRESCYWLLTSNGRISISFESFYTESCCDKVYVYDGGSSSSRLLGQYSGTKIPPKLTSSFKQLYVRFTSDGSVTYRGFSVRYGPPGYLQASGYYIYINTDSNRRFGDTARFASKFLPATSGTCLSFWYHMYGSDINALNVILKSNQRNTTVWSRKGESGNRWLEGKVTISTNDTYKIAFEGVAGSGIEGHIALDDISLSKGACNISRSCQDQICYNDGNPYCLNNTGYCYCSSDTYGDKCQFVNYNCSFDKGICRHLWTQDSKNDQLDWNRQRGPSWPYTTGPSRDHTSGNGYYMTIRSRYQRKGNAAHLISRQLPSTNQSCLAFWYHMYGTNIGTLRIVRKYGNENVTIWSRNGQSGNRWLQGKVDLESHHEFQLIFEGVVGGYYGDIALDDVSLINETCSIPDSCRNHFCHNDGHAYCMNNTGYCYCSHENIGKYCEKYRCTFDQDYCQNRWYQDRNDNFDWYRRSYSAGVSNTGPSSDHTTGRGYYLYIYTYYRRLGDTARFVSKTLPATNSTCLSFWYHMYGRDINTLRIILNTSSNGNSTIWSRTGESGNRWLEGKVTIISNEPYQIIFESVAGGGAYGEIAIDDISMTNGTCNISESCRNQRCPKGSNPYCLNNTGYCYCSPGTSGDSCQYISSKCNFDKDVCDMWYQGKSDKFDWTRYRGYYWPSTTGPSADHTSGYGYYMFIDSRYKGIGDTARLISRHLPATNQACLVFWYHMYGINIGTLRIVKKTGTQNVTIWSRNGQSGNRWLQGNVDLESDNKFQLIIEGDSGGYYGYIAIDDVSITEGTCNISQSCRDQVCYNGGNAYCLNNTGHCYCPDDSIGQQCERYRCDFNKDWCQSFWRQERTTDRFDWTRNQGSTPVANTGPSGDHNSEVSHQIYITVQTSCTYTTINKYSGRFTSPNYPSYYKNRENCYWLLTSNGRISISFESFYTESCCDKVYVYDGGSSSSRLLGQYSGYSLPPKLTSSSKQLYVRFISDGSVTYRGFSAKYGPAGQASGYYIFINTPSNRRFGDTARFVSKSLPATSGTCLSFWYHMYGSDINALNVILKSSLRNTTVWSRKGESGNRWLEGKFTINTTNTHQIVFEGVVGSGIEGHIALDDISLNRGDCNISSSCRDQICYNDGNPYCLNNTGYCYCSSDTYGDKCQFEYYNCSFDNGICRHLWNQDTAQDQLDWMRQRGSLWPYTTGPSRDHTNGNGYYLTIHARYQRIGNAARLISRQLPATNQACLVFWYHMYGINIGTLRVLKKNGTQNVTIWSKNGQRGNRWLQGKVNLESDNEFQLVLEGVVGGYYGDIAIDDVSLINETCVISESCRNHFCYNGGQAYCMNNTGYCYCPRETIGKHCEIYRCTFDQDFCQMKWYQDRLTDNFDWYRASYYAGVSNTGPSSDHTTGRGYYLYIYTNYKRHGDTARFVSKTLPATNSTCLSFWYHMYGRDINTLRIILNTASNGNSTIWSRIGESGNRWLEGKAKIASNESYQIIFEGVAGGGAYGEIAIDDISMSNGTCNISKSCQNQKCLNGGNPYCYYNIGYCYCQPGTSGEFCQHVSLSCSFEKDLCLWYQDKLDEFDWIRYRGNYWPSTTGPSSDHTTGYGYYMFINSRYQRLGNTARLVSRHLPATNQACLVFWYHMYGTNIGTLRILKQNGTQNVTIWSRNGQSGNRWLQGKVDFESQHEFQLVIEGISGGYYGYIAIDDVSMKNGTCNISRSCRDQTCYIGGHAYCLNNTGHCYCPDDSIGQQCERYRCNFNKDWCDSMWHQDRTTDRFDWTRNRGPTSVANTGPSEDHNGGQVSHQTYITVKTSCTYTSINKYSGRFTSPNYPSNYKNRENCYWLLTSNERISISFESFYTESCCDKVYVYDGGSSSSRLLGQYSGSSLPSKLTSSFKQLYVRFTSDGSVTYRGFSAKYGPAGYIQAAGYYIYIYTASYRRLGDTARFVTKSLPATKNTCLSFWYHMYGRNINTLRVIVKTKEFNNTIIWSRTGEIGNEWLEGKVNITTNETYQIVFEGVAGSGIYGHIALDDISIYRGTCNISSAPEPSTSQAPTFNATTTAMPTTKPIHSWPITTERTSAESATTEIPTPGPTTTKAPRPCKLNITCYNGGSSSCNVDTGHQFCKCPPGYIGQQCGYKDMRCPELACFNGGYRICTKTGQAMCICPRGITGRQCKKKIVVCPIIHCLNGGTMACASNGQAFCRCPTGHNGNNCQKVAEDDSSKHLSCYHCNTTSCKSGEKQCAENDNKCATITTGNFTTRSCVHQNMCSNYCNNVTNCTIHCCDQNLCNRDSTSSHVKPTLMLIIITTVLVMVNGWYQD